MKTFNRTAGYVLPILACPCLSLPGQQHLRACLEEGDSTSEEFTLLPEPEWRRHRGPLHEPHPHLRVLRGQSLRLLERATATRQRARRELGGLDALELPPNARRCHDIAGNDSLTTPQEIGNPVYVARSLSNDPACRRDATTRLAYRCPAGRQFPPRRLIPPSRTNFSRAHACRKDTLTAGRVQVAEPVSCHANPPTLSSYRRFSVLLRVIAWLDPLTCSSSAITKLWSGN